MSEADLPNDASLQNIIRYHDEARSHHREQMDLDTTQGVSLEQQLDQTIQELKQRVENRRVELEKIRVKSNASLPVRPSEDDRERLIQLRSIKLAYDELSAASPELPPPGSLIPAVTAAEAIGLAIRETRNDVTSVQAQLESAQRQEDQESSNLSDAKILATTIEDRISRLQIAQQERSSQTPAEAVRQSLLTKQRHQKNFQDETQRLHDALDRFIDSHLAAMLAAEELGGPVVGHLAHVDEDMLTAGFTARGEPTKAKNPATQQSGSKRQTRIDDIWGAGSARSRSELEAAGDDVRQLLRDLMHALAGKSSSGVYISLSRDSAAARFLVRAKVAQFHPRDARRLRLIDFGRELDQ